MTDRWSLRTLLSDLHDDIEQQLATARRAFGHNVLQGDASENVWLELLQRYLPMRYEAHRAVVVDSNGRFSEQIDIVICDRQYTPIIFHFQGQKVMPAESVYAVFEAKQSANATHIDYAEDKVASVRRLHRTSLPIRHAGGEFAAIVPPHIVGGLLTFESDWNLPLDEPLRNALASETAEHRLDLGCFAARGTFSRNTDNTYTLMTGGKPATTFLFDLIGRLQEAGTVPRIDMGAYARCLASDEEPREP